MCIHSTHSIREEQISFREIYKFLKREIDSGYTVYSQNQAKDDFQSRFFESMSAVIDAADDVLNTSFMFNELLKTRDPDNADEDPYYYRDVIRRTQSSLPELLNAISNAYMQRRHRRIAQVLGSANPSTIFRFSEVHLVHPVTVAGVENINFWIHSSLEKFWGDFDILGPLVVIAQGRRPAFVQSMEDASRNYPLVKMGLLEPDRKTNFEILRKHFGHVVNFSYITMPRWSPSTIRYFALLAHEHWHRLMHLGQTITDVNVGLRRFVDDKYSREALKISEEEYDRAIKIWSEFKVDTVIFLNSLHTQFAQRIEVFLGRMKIPGLTPDGQYDSDIKVLLRTVAEKHAEEFMCDLGALALLGPSYLFSTASLFLRNPESEEEDLAGLSILRQQGRTHPPSVVRTSLMCRILIDRGFAASAVMLREFGISEIIDYEDKALPLTSAYFEYLLTDECYSLINEIIDFFASTNDDTLKSSDNFIIGPGLKTEAKKNQEIWETVIDKVNAGEIFPEDLKNYRPSDILNAIWLKMYNQKFEQQVEQRMAWRLALRNVGTGKEE